MTCIVGLAQGGDVFMGGDSLGVSGYSRSVLSNPKVFKRGPFLIGFTTSFRMGQVLQHALEAPCHPEGVGDHEYMVTLFVDAVRECLKRAGFATKQNEAEAGGTFLVGYRGELYEVASDYQVINIADNYIAIGCGSDIALGAMFAAGHTDEPIARLRLALEAAAKFSTGVGEPFIFLSSGSGGV